MKKRLLNFRQCHEVCLIGVKGKIYQHITSKSIRSVHFAPIGEHSEKPEILQDYLDKLIKDGNRCELFARRDRKGYHCVGNQVDTPFCPKGEDITVSIEKLSKL